MAGLFQQLPPELLDTIVGHLGLEGTWRSSDEVIRDYAALAMTSRSMAALAQPLASHIQRHLRLPEGRKMVHVPRPTVPGLLNLPTGLGASSSMQELRTAARSNGVASAKSRAETWQRIQAAVAENAALRERRAERQAAWDAGERAEPVPKSPVPPALRKRVLEEQRMTAKGAKARFCLGDKDLTKIPVMLKRNPFFGTAAPMRLYSVVDLRVAAAAKFGGIEELEAQKEKRARRAERMAEVMNAARDRRKDVLERALQARGCELRCDSRLCASYIATGQGDVEHIADVAAEMKFVHEHTDYEDILERMIQEAREFGERFHFHRLSYFARQEAIEEYVSQGENMHLLPAHLR